MTQGEAVVRARAGPHFLSLLVTSHVMRVATQEEGAVVPLSQARKQGPEGHLYQARAQGTGHGEPSPPVSTLKAPPWSAGDLSKRGWGTVAPSG